MLALGFGVHAIATLQTPQKKQRKLNLYSIVIAKHESIVTRFRIQYCDGLLEGEGSEHLSKSKNV